MYTITDEQINFILTDIRTRGVEMVSLQHDLLDHICCVIEHELEPGGDFDRFYQSVLPRFYKSELREIETETAYLLTNKYFYKMKKIMITSGALATGLLSVGIFLKFMHLPGAAVLILLGIVILSFIFLPLLFALRVREKQETSDKIISVIGGLAAMLISLGILFKIMHWPGANIMCMSALLLMLVVFIPVYFFAGIRNPATKVNTIVSSIMMFTGCVLIVTLIKSPAKTHSEKVAETRFYLDGEKILHNQRQSIGSTLKGQSIYTLCDELKSFLLQNETGLSTMNALDDDNLIGATWSASYFSDNASALQKLDRLKKEIESYNAQDPSLGLPVQQELFDLNQRVSQSLNSLVQIQMVVLQNEQLVAMK